MPTLSLSLVSHTNTGKTTLARTLLGADIGEVRDAPHVTEFADAHELIHSPEGDRLQLWDTPGFGDSARLAQRLRGSSNPLGWFLSQVWDRWRDRPFWASQQALRHVQAQSDVVLYLVNAAESPAAAGYVAAEMELLAWLGKPVLVLLNQLGEPRAPALEAAEVDTWRQHLRPWPLVCEVLPMDAFARCWVHELTLLRAVQQVLQGEQASTMARLVEAWRRRGQATFDAAITELATSVARMALAREPLSGAPRLRDTLRHWGQQLSGRGDGDTSPAARAQQALAQRLHDEAAASTGRLISLHGLAGPALQQTRAQIMDRVAGQFALQAHVPEGKAALVGGAVSGALVGLKADVLTGGLTLGGGLLAGALLGALGAAGVARGINVVRGTDHSWVRVDDAAMAPLVQAALLRYLAVAHFGRGRGAWVQGEAPPHWRETVAAALALQQPALAALWQAREGRLARSAWLSGGPGRTQGPQFDTAADADAAAAAAAADRDRDRGAALVNDQEAPATRLAETLQPLLAAATREVFEQLYPATDNRAA